MTAIIVIILVLAVIAFVIKNLMAEGFRSRHSTSAVHKDVGKKAKSQQKQNKVARDKQSRFSTTSKPKAKKSNVIGNTATVLAGAALAHQLRKHHKNDDAEDIFDEDKWDDELYDYDYQDYDDIDYDNYIAEQIEEQVAYDDYIASLDMADD